MVVSAITGTICSGKTTVLEIFRKKGASIFNCDQQIHEWFKDAVSPVYSAIAEHFPEVISNRVGVDRQLLGSIVFSNSDKLRELEEIVHPVIIKTLREWIKVQRKSSAIAVAEVPLLFEKQLETLFDVVIFVCAQDDVVWERVRNKGTMTIAQLEVRRKRFLACAQRIRKSDFLIYNNGSFTELYEQSDAIWKKLIAKN